MLENFGASELKLIMLQCESGCVYSAKALHVAVLSSSGHGITMLRKTLGLRKKSRNSVILIAFSISALIGSSINIGVVGSVSTF